MLCFASCVFVLSEGGRICLYVSTYSNFINLVAIGCNGSD